MDLYRIFHPKAEKYTFFSNAYGTFSRIDHLLGHRTSLYKIKITSSILFNHNGMN